MYVCDGEVLKGKRDARESIEEVEKGDASQQTCSGLPLVCVCECVSEIEMDIYIASLYCKLQLRGLV